MASKDGQPLRVMVVDDYLDDLEMFSRYLIRQGCEVRTFSDPTTCLDTARTFHPHIVFMDLAMPRMNGLALARALRLQDVRPFLLIARTGFADAKTKASCLEGDFNLVLTKPGNTSEINRLLETARRFATT